MLHYEVVEKNEHMAYEHRAEPRWSAPDVHTPGDGTEQHSSVLVCLHGFLESISMWDVLELEKHSRLILIDLPGHGKSDLSGIDSMREMAQRVLEVVDHEKLSEYNVIGHSMGGYVGLELKTMDNRCQNLILLNSNIWADSDPKKLDRERVAKLVQTKKERFLLEAIPNLFEKPESYQEVVNKLIAEANQMSSEAIARSSIAMSKRKDYTESAFSGEMPVTVIQGENDSIADRARMEQVMINYPEQFFVVQSGHMSYWEATEEVKQIVQSVI